MPLNLSRLLFLALAASPAVLGVPTNYGSQPACLTYDESIAITNNWDGFFIGHFGPLDTTLAANFQAFNQDFTNGADVPWAKSRDDYHTQIVASLDPSKSDDIQYVAGQDFVLHTCDTIVLRWHATTRSTKLNEQKGGVKAGTIVHYKGTDIISVDLKTRLMTKVVASNDGLNHAEQLGEKLTY